MFFFPPAEDHLCKNFEGDILIFSETVQSLEYHGFYCFVVLSQKETQDTWHQADTGAVCSPLVFWRAGSVQYLHTVNISDEVHTELHLQKAHRAFSPKELWKILPETCNILAFCYWNQSLVQSSRAPWKAWTRGTSGDQLHGTGQGTAVQTALSLTCSSLERALQRKELCIHRCVLPILCVALVEQRGSKGRKDFPTDICADLKMNKALSLGQPRKKET